MNPDSRKIRLILNLRSEGITDTRVLSAMERVPRELFVPEAFHDKAYEDVALPIGHHQTVSRPSVVARMTQALAPGDRDKVLEIGTGSGYQAAVLSTVCRRLYTMERFPELLEEAEARFAQLQITNITTLAEDGSKGWPAQAPFDRILVTAAAGDVLDALLDQLAVGGFMVMPVESGGSEQRLVRVTRTEDGAETEDMGAISFVPMREGRASN